jgi:hypothetical protein
MPSVIRRIGASFVRALLWLLGFWLLAFVVTIAGTQIYIYGFSSLGAEVLFWVVIVLFSVGVLGFVVILALGLARRR